MSSPYFLSTSCLLMSLSLVPRVYSTCYNPDGTQVGVDDIPLRLAFQPCNQVVGTTSMCCGTNWTGAISKDICQPNGLCLNSYNDAPLLWRSSCSDPTWKSPLCLSSLCTDPDNGGDPTQNVAVRECDDGTWCCGGSNITCCSKKLGISIAATIGETVSTTSSSSSTAATPTTTSASTTSSTQASTINPSPTAVSAPTNSTNTVAIGVGLGVGLFVATVALAGSIFWWRKRARKAANKVTTSPIATEMYADQLAKPFYGQSSPAENMSRQEMSGDSPAPAEMGNENYGQVRL